MTRVPPGGAAAVDIKMRRALQDPRAARAPRRSADPCRQASRRAGTCHACSLREPVGVRGDRVVARAPACAQRRIGATGCARAGAIRILAGGARVVEATQKFWRVEGCSWPDAFLETQPEPLCTSANKEPRGERAWTRAAEQSVWRLTAWMVRFAFTARLRESGCELTCVALRACRAASSPAAGRARPGSPSPTQMAQRLHSPFSPPASGAAGTPGGERTCQAMG